MLAALAFPVQERLEPILAKAFNLPDELKETLGRSPSIVNGGLEQGEIPLTIFAFLAGGAIVEYLTNQRKKEQGAAYVSGDIGLPYVGAANAEEQALRQLQELQFGRMAMVAVLVYVIEESVFKTSILRETALILQELGNVKSLETDLAQGVLSAEKGSSAVIQELGNLKQLELDVASLSSKVTEFAKQGEELVVKDLEGSALQNIKAAGEAKTAMLSVMGRKAKPAPVQKSEALPWADRPKSLEGTSLAGDSGFDPLGLFGADPFKVGWDQAFYREAELKHARLGMLAALAYPVQEKLEPVLAKAFNLPDELQETLGRSPSIVNGGLEQGEIPLTIVAFLAGGVLVEYLTDKLKKEQGAEYVTGDIGLPYVYASTVEQQALRQLQELQLGRLAMVSVLVYVIEESVFKTSILRETVAIFQELANVKSLETDLAQGIVSAEKGSSAVLQELGNVKQLELRRASGVGERE